MINNLKFGNAAINVEEYNFLYNITKLNIFKNILEFGPGTSTYSFLENGCNVVTLELSNTYIEKNYSDLKNKCKIIYYDINSLHNVLLDETFDLAFVDGPIGTKSFSRLESCLFSIKYAKHLLLHDFTRIGEEETILFILSEFSNWKKSSYNIPIKFGYIYDCNKTNPLITI